LFGCPNLNGGQAEYVRIPHADGTVMKAPSSVPEKALILMADILPTGFYGVKSALAMAQGADVSQSTMVIIGAGPVGCCAALSALHFKPKHLFVIDSVDSRLDIARKLGAEPLNFQKDPAGMKARVMEVTEGRGADMVVEVVGLSPALRTAFDLVRPFGVISSIGVHNAEVIMLVLSREFVSVCTDAQHRSRGPRLKDTSESEKPFLVVAIQLTPAKQKSAFPNGTMPGAQGLCGIAGYPGEIPRETEVCLPCLEHERRAADTAPSFMFDKIVPLSDAVEAYDLFDKRQVQKVVFTV